MKDILNYFTIGESYEKNEFNLQSVKTILIRDLEYEVYKYDKNMSKALFGSGIVEIYLYYNIDILSMIQFTLEEETDLELLIELFNDANLRCTINERNLYIINKQFNFKDLYNHLK